MSENISRLMDGEVDEAELDAVCAALKGGDAMATWTCYHAIGDALRGEVAVTRDVRAAVARRLAEEPTVLAPRRSMPSRPASWAWAAAATLAAVSVVGYTAYSMVGATPEGLARVRDAGTMRAADARPA
ncbi:MAG TPA: sigma-E factor negative regulatory protein, partial [Casimicrobiaceae bacterium]|nr:sigma-E factor negative regulatory protein [Casimicrobiaceae bacterium]